MKNSLKREVYKAVSDDRFSVFPLLGMIADGISDHGENLISYGLEDSKENKEFHWLWKRIVRLMTEMIKRDFFINND